MRFVWAVFALSLLGTVQPRAEEQLAEGIYELGEIVVSASRIEAEAVGTLRIVTAQDILNSGARTLDEAIGLLPGVYVRMAATGTPRIDIRGFRTRHVQLLLNGIPINDTYDGQFDPTLLSVENIAQIKLTTGGSSVLYGTGGNGGVINIITRNSAQKIQGSAHAEVGQSGTFLGKLAFSGASETWRAFVSGGTSRRDGFRLSDHFSATAEEDGGMRNNSDYKRDNAYANIDFRPSDQTLFGLTLSVVQGAHGAPPVVNFNQKDPFTKRARYDRTSDLENYAFQWAMRHAFKKPLTFKAWIVFAHLDMIEDRFDDATYATQAKNGATHSETTTRAIGAHTQTQYLFARQGVVTLALSFNRDTWQNQGFSVNRNNIAVSFDDDQHLQGYTAALQYDVSPREVLGLVAGVGYHHQNRTGDGKGDASYLAGVRYDIRDNTRLRASLSRKVRFPSIRQLYETGSGDPTLRAERSMHWELGIAQQLADKATVSAVGFVIDARDFIEKDQSNLFQNFETYRFRGFELMLESNPVDALSLAASYAHLRTTDKSAGAGRETLQYRPRHTASLQMTCRFGFGLSAYGSVLYVVDQVFYSESTPVQKKALNNYAIANIRLRQVLIPDMLECYMGVDNLFDRHYEQSYGLPQPGRMARSGLKLRF